METGWLQKDISGSGFTLVIRSGVGVSIQGRYWSAEPRFMKSSSKSKFEESVGKSGETFSNTASDELKMSSCRVQCVENESFSKAPLHGNWLGN